MKALVNETLQAADTACDQAYLAYQQADEWCRLLSRGWNGLLERHDAIAAHLESAITRLGRGDETDCDMDGLWSQAQAVQGDMDALMSCRRAAGRRAHAAGRAHEEAVREWYRLMAEVRRVAP